MLMAVSIAQSLAAFLMLRVARPAARCSTPTWSTPGRPWRNRRRDDSSRVASASAGGNPALAVEGAAMRASLGGALSSPGCSTLLEREWRRAPRRPDALKDPFETLNVLKGSFRAFLGRDPGLSPRAPCGPSFSCGASL